MNILSVLSALRPLHSVLSVAFAFSLIWSWSSGYKDAVTWGAFAYVLYDAIRRRKMFDCGGIGLPLLAFLIICGISAFTSVTPRDSRSSYLKLLELAAGCVALINLMRPGSRAVTATRSIAFAMLALAVIDSILLLLDLRNPDTKNFLSDERWKGSHYGFPTIAAAVIATGFVLIAALVMQTKKLMTRAACVVGLVLCGILFSHFQTRSVFLGLGCGLLVLLLATIKEPKRALAAVALCGLVLAGAMFGAPKLRERVLSGSSSGREDIWADARYQISRQIPQYNRFFGYGYGHGVLKETYKMTRKKNIRAKVRLDHTHNMMLEITLQTGWFGLAAWLWLLGAALVRTARSMWTATGERRWAIGAIAAALVVLIVYGQFSAFFALAPHFLFWNLLGLLLAACASATPEKFQTQEKSAP